MTADRRPAIHQIGNVAQIGTTLKVTGWGLRMCLSQCTCHRMLPFGQLRVYEGPDGSLGMAKMRPDCDCCSPWTFEELSAIVAELAEIQAAPEVSR